MGFLTFITALLAAFKLAGLTTISWWLVISPVFVGFGVMVVFSLLIAVMAVLTSNK